MSSITSNFFSSSECERLKSLLKNPEKDLEEIISLLEYKAELKLRESEQKFRTITEQTLMGISIVQDNKIKYINKAYSEIFGYTVEEMMTWEMKDGINAIHPDDRAFAIDQLTKKQRGEKDVVVHYQYRGIKKSGEIVWVDQFSRSITYQGMPAIFISLVNITKYKEVEEAFLREKKFTDTALNAQRDTFFIFELSTGKAVRWNNAFKEVSGYNDEEIRNLKAPDSYYDDHDLKLAASAIEKMIKEGEALIGINLIAKDGRKIPFEYIGSTINDDEENPIYIVAIGRDISERKKAEQKLKESEKKFRTAVENSPDFIVFINPDGIIFDVNRLDKGFTRETVIGQSFFNDYFYETEEQCESARKAFRDALEN